MPHLVEIGPVGFGEKIFNFIFLISQLSPLWEGGGPSFKQTRTPFTQGYFVPSYVEIGPVVLENENVKSLQTDEQTDRQADEPNG